MQLYKLTSLLPILPTTHACTHTNHFNGHFPGKPPLAICRCEKSSFDRAFYHAGCPSWCQLHFYASTTTPDGERASLFVSTANTKCPLTHYTNKYIYKRIQYVFNRYAYVEVNKPSSTKITTRVFNASWSIGICDTNSTLHAWLISGVNALL